MAHDNPPSQSSAVQNNPSSNLNLHKKYGLEPSFEDILIWADKENIINEILLMIDVCNFAHENRKIAPLLHFLKQAQQSLEFLASSQTHSEPDSVIGILNNIAQALFRNDSILQNYYSQPNLKARSQFSGSLKEQYLLAMLYEVHFKGEPNWYLHLKLWVLEHAVHRFVYYQNTLDSHLKEVADKIRLAAEKDELHDIFIQLRPYDYQTLHLNTLIIQKASNIKTDSLIEKKLVSSLLKVARYENSPMANDKTTRFVSSNSYIRSCQPVELDNIQPKPSTFVEPEEDIETIGVFDSDDNTPITLIKTKELQFYWHQRLGAKSIVLAQQQQSQFLPWSWFRLNPYEIEQFHLWVENLLASSEPIEQFFALVLWTAAKTGRSLAWVLEIKCSEEIHDEWSLDIKNSVLHRKPPKRHSSWKPQKTQKAWIPPAVEKIIIELPDPIIDIIEQHRTFISNAQSLGDIWQADWLTQQQYFTRHKPPALFRVSAAMVGNIQEQEYYKQTHDPSYAKLLSSHPKSGLPAQCAYPGWQHETVYRSLNPGNEFLLQNGIALGSRLDPLEVQLQDAIRQATQKLKLSAKSQNVIRFHNDLTAYLVVSLLAATGARPVQDPFESPELFDFDQSLVYIEDKSIPNRQSGRLVPLPAELCDFIQRHYTAHLKSLAQCLQKANIELADDIAQLSQCQSSEHIPFFFFLNESTGQWYHVSESAIYSLDLFNWPLPLNLFRHRLSNQARYKKIDPEIIDGWLGHAESQTATYSNYSVRCWQDDRNNTDKVFSEIFGQLGFQFESIITQAIYNSKNLHIKEEIGKTTNKKTIQAFGSRARAEKRKLRAKSTIKQAKFEIDDFLQKKSLTDLSEEDIDRLSRLMLFSAKGQPRSNGPLRYRYFIKKLEQAYLKKDNSALKLRHFYQPQVPENSLFTESAINAITCHSDLRTKLYQVLKATQLPRVSFNDAALLSALLLIAENRITSKELLIDILTIRNYRLVQYKEQYYLEYAKDLESLNPYTPVKRFEISTHCAWLLNKGLSKPTALNTEKMVISAKYQPLFDIPNKTGNTQANVPEQIKAIAKRVEQANAIELPGLACAWLDGRVDSYSLNWNDWLRMEKNQPVDLSTLMENNHSKKEWPMQWLSNLSANPVSKEKAHQATKQLFKAMREALKAAGQIRANRSLSKNSRRDLSLTLEKLIKQYSQDVGSAIILVAKWLQQFVLQRKKSSGERTYLKISTIERYLSSVSQPFARIAGHIDLLSLDEQDVTQFYNDLIDSHQSGDVSYFCKRLVNFHKYAQMQGVSEPDWNEVAIIDTPTLVSTGSFSENDYQKCLKLIISSADISDELRNACAFLLLCCYRFLLRSAEALGLTQQEWVYSVDVCEPEVIVIQKNKWRDLKSRSSRRQIPLLFSLSALEKDIIKKQWADSVSKAGNTPESLLFSKEQREQSAHIKRIVIACLRQVTNNRKLVLHHARHAGANRIFKILLDINDSENLPDKNAINDIKERLLNDHNISRRTSHALALILGHTHPVTSFKNYIHCMDDYTQQLISFESKSILKRKTNLEQCIKLDKITPTQSNIEYIITDKILNYNPLSIPLILQYFRLLTMGKSWQEAAQLLSIRLTDAKRLIQLVQDINSGMKIKENSHKNNLSIDHAFLFLIKNSAWNRLIEYGIQLTHNKKIEDLSESYHFNLTNIIGRQRQILLWNDEHWKFIKNFINVFSINKNTSLFDIVCLDNINNKNKNLKLIAVSDYKKEFTSFKFDRGFYEKKEQWLYKKRCAFCYNDNKKHIIRNRYELIIVLIAFYLIHHRG